MNLSGQLLLQENLGIADAATDEMALLARQQARFVYQVAFSVLRNHHDAEDITQETFVRVLRRRRQWGQIRNPRAWLARTAWRLALDRYRQRRRTASLDDLAAAVAQLRASGASAEEIAANRQMTMLLETLMASLPAKFRAPLILSTVQEMSAAEVAAVLRMPESSVRTRVHRARRLLRGKLNALLERGHER
jgi:RNA polymerase sigma-70 factor (ECF subfamily)